MDRAELLSRTEAYATEAYTASMQAASAQLTSAANSANQAYILAAKTAGAQAGIVGSEQALETALNRLAEQGISISTYTRKDGTVVHTPVDVGVRRLINDQVRQRGIQQVCQLANELGRNYIEVSITANCRESHEAWQGKIYSINRQDDTYPYFFDACKYGDPVDGIGGYNCGHDVHIYRPEIGRTFSDPLEGTGYTTEEVRALTTQQRALENDIRKIQRQIACNEAAGLDTSALNAKLATKQNELASLISKNSKVLTSGGSYRTALTEAQTRLYVEAFKKRLQALASLPSQETSLPWSDYIQGLKSQWDSGRAAITQMGENQLAVLSEEQRGNLNSYTGGMYQIWNHMKRYGMENTPVMDLLDNALSASSTTQDLFARRDSGKGAIRDLLQKVGGESSAIADPSILVGQEWMDNAYLSSTLLPDGSWFHGEVTLYLYAHEGSNAIYIDPVSLYSGKEFEVLFAPQTEWTVRHAEYSDGGWRLWLESI